LAAGLILRLGWALSRGQSIENLPDQVEYVACAKAMLQGGRCSFNDVRFDQIVYAQRTIGYPAFIAMLRANVTAVRIAQCLLDTSAALAVFLIARRYLSQTRSLCATAVVVFNPFLIYFCALLLTETLFTAILAWSAYLMLNRRWIVCGAMLASIGVLIRPSGLVMPILLAALAGFAATEHRIRRALAYGAVSALVLVLVLFPWAMRNKQVLGRWVWLSTNGGITLYDGVQPQATGASDQSFLKDFPVSSLRDMGELGRDDYFQQLANQQIRQNPLRIGWLAIKKTARTWSPIPLSEQYGSNRLYVIVGLLYCLPLLILYLVGIRCSLLPRQIRLVLFGPAIAITLMHALSVGSLRYRIPAEPLLAIVAASITCTKQTQAERDRLSR
jgi:4-amino-4-deoxy-L-arabinose transferase-like glycosyltransferase